MRPGRTTRSSPRLVATLVVAAALLAAGVVGLGRPGTVVAGTPAPGRAVGAPDTGRVPAGRTGPSSAHDPGRSVVAGTRLRVPRLAVDAPVVHVAVRVRDGQRVMQVPRDPHTVGWWTGSARPGSGSGAVVVVGHVNYDGVPGALGALPRARPGDRVSLQSPRGRTAYRVTGVRSYAKTRGIPTVAFRGGGTPRLVLITCGGPFDPGSGNYEDNVVVYAVPAAA